jgi:DNA-binding NarL/FixJ family response regulator
VLLQAVMPHAACLPASSEDDPRPTEPPATHPARRRLDWPLTKPADPLWGTALEADAEGSALSGLASVWAALVKGEIKLWCDSIGLERAYLVARVCETRDAQAASLCATEASVALRVLCGDPQKAVAAELRISPSTASSRCARATGKLALGSGAVPLALVVAAQSHADVVHVPEGRCAFFEHDGRACLVLSVPRPVTAGIGSLTRSEQQIAQLVIEGGSRHEIAMHRSTSEKTVASQVHSIFAAMRVTGRYALIRRAAELGCFSKQATR